MVVTKLNINEYGSKIFILEIHCTHQEEAFALLLGADSLYTEIRSVENLGLSAIMIFT